MVVVRPWKLPRATMISARSVRDALDAVAPAARRLDRGLDGLGAGVHRQRLVEAGRRRTRRSQEGAEHVAVVGAAR